MKANSRQAIVGDIGGTHARLAIADVDELAITNFVVFRSKMFASLKDIVAAYIESIPYRPRMAAFGIAGPTGSATFRPTNLPWSFTYDELKAAAGVEHLLVINDFEALARALPSLTDHDLNRISGDQPAEGATKVVLGPGTGLGVAGLASSPSGWVAVASEGGHMSFPCENQEELAIVDRMREDGGHVSFERLISGPGLARLYEVLGSMKGQEVEPLPVPDIVKRALAKDDALAEEALGLFVNWLGRFAGDVALAYGARGGIYVGGGIVPRILDLMKDGTFRTAFLSKGRLASFLEQIPVYVIRAHDAGLRGAAVALSADVPAT